MSRLEWLVMGLLLVGGGAGGYWLSSSMAPQPEVISQAAEVRQPDGSVIAERKPMAKPPKAPHQIRRGAKEERRVAVTVQPKREDCPPVSVDLSLVREADGRRVVASSPDGTVIDALDMPIESALIAAPVLPWAAGVSYDPFNRRYGAWVERDIARLRVGADVQQGEAGELRVLVRAGWRW